MMAPRQKDQEIMNDVSGNPRGRPLKTLVGAKALRTKTLPVDEIIVDARRRPVNDAKVSEMMESIEVLGLLQPIVVTRRTNEDGGEEYRLIGGGHRLEAYKRRGLPTIPCTLLEFDQALRVELAEIDENFIRNDPSQAEHALLTGRRREIMLELAAQDGTVLQDETASRQRKRRDGQETGPDLASLTDQANKTGEHKAKIQRSRKRFETLGGPLLAKVVGTSLDTGVELNALMKLPHAEREDLAGRAGAGEAVTARKSRSKAEREEKQEPQHEASAIDIEHAMDEFWLWYHKYKGAWEAEGVFDQIEDIAETLIAVFTSTLKGDDLESDDLEADSPEMASEQAKKSKWLNWRKGREVD
jgi:ParB-like chromosome segregation protein Spo0J